MFFLSFFEGFSAQLRLAPNAPNLVCPPFSTSGFFHQIKQTCFLHWERCGLSLAIMGRTVLMSFPGFSFPTCEFRSFAAWLEDSEELLRSTTFNWFWVKCLILFDGDGCGVLSQKKQAQMEIKSSSGGFGPFERQHFIYPHVWTLSRIVKVKWVGIGSQAVFPRDWAFLLLFGRFPFWN